MGENFSFDEFEKKEMPDNLPSTSINPALSPKEKKGNLKPINFQELSDESKEILNINEKKELVEKYTKEESIPMPYEGNNSNSYLSLVLAPNLRELELMIRGLEYVKRFNQVTGRDEVILRKIKDHPLNEYGVNKIMEYLKIYTSPELKLGRKRLRDYYNSVQQVGRDIVRLIYKNLKNFGMDTQVKQRNAKTFALAIIEVTDATFSRSIEGKENDLSRATEFKIEGNIDTLNDPAKLFTKQQKEQLKQ